jgi:N-acetylneuraminic acid mutarotase
MPTALTGLGVATVDGKIYAIVWGVNYEYDPSTNSWTTKTPMPTSRGSFATAVVENKIYCIGGYSDFLEFTDANEVYDPATDTWEIKTPMPSTRAQLCASVVNDKIYCIGGEIPVYYATALTGSNQIYDPETDSWTEGAYMPNFEGFGSSLITSAVFDDKIYVMCEDFNQMYDPQTNNWSSKAMMPVPGKSVVACATSGQSAPKRIHVLDVSTHQTYNPENDTWTNGTAMPTPRWLFGLAVVNDEIYAIGGRTTTTYLAVNEKYTPTDYIPEFSSWTILSLVLIVTLFSIIIKKSIRGH